MEMTKEFAELIGIMYGDGCLSSRHNKNVVYISGHKHLDFDYHNKTTRNLFLNVCGKNTTIKERKDENTLFIKFSDKSIFDNFRTIGMPVGKKENKLSIPSKIKDNPYLTCYFLRGLADTDGCVVFSKQHKKYRY